MRRKSPTVRPGGRELLVMRSHDLVLTGAASGRKSQQDSHASLLNMNMDVMSYYSHLIGCSGEVRSRGRLSLAIPFLLVINNNDN